MKKIIQEKNSIHFKEMNIALFLLSKIKKLKNFLTNSVDKLHILCYAGLQQYFIFSDDLHDDQITRM
jgi:hypothetical protein